MGRGIKVFRTQQFHVHYCQQCGARISHGGPVDSCRYATDQHATMTCFKCGSTNMSRKARKTDSRSYRRSHHVRRAG